MIVGFSILGFIMLVTHYRSITVISAWLNSSTMKLTKKQLLYMSITSPLAIAGLLIYTIHEIILYYLSDAE
jgi:hypothetical protein